MANPIELYDLVVGWYSRNQDVTLDELAQYSNSIPVCADQPISRERLHHIIDDLHNQLGSINEVIK